MRGSDKARHLSIRWTPFGIPTVIEWSRSYPPPRTLSKERTGRDPPTGLGKTFEKGVSERETLALDQAWGRSQYPGRRRIVGSVLRRGPQADSGVSIPRCRAGRLPRAHRGRSDQAIRHRRVGETWFRWFYHKDQKLKRHPFSEGELRDAFFGAARALRLEIFGGDAVVTSDGSIYIIDINAWPSFALFRREASAAIARHILTKISESVPHAR